MSTIIHCTQKLLTEIPDRLLDPTATGESWHANLLHFDRRKCALFTHDATLYSVFIPGLKKVDFEIVEHVFGQQLFKTMLRDELTQEQIERMLDTIRTVRCTRSSNRSVLGSMNDIRYHIEATLVRAGGLAGVDLFDLHHRLNRIPFAAIGYQYPVDRLAMYLAKQKM